MIVMESWKMMLIAVSEKRRTLWDDGACRHHAPSERSATACATIAYQAYVTLHQWCIVQSCDEGRLQETETEGVVSLFTVWDKYKLSAQYRSILKHSLSHSVQ